MNRITLAVLVMFVSCASAFCQSITPAVYKETEVSASEMLDDPLEMNEASSLDLYWTFKQNGYRMKFLLTDVPTFVFSNSNLWSKAVTGAIYNASQGRVKFAFKPTDNATNGFYQYNVFVSRNGSNLLSRAGGHLTLETTAGSTNTFPLAKLVNLAGCQFINFPWSVDGTNTFDVRAWSNIVIDSGYWASNTVTNIAGYTGQWEAVRGFTNAWEGVRAFTGGWESVRALTGNLELARGRTGDYERASVDASFATNWIATNLFSGSVPVGVIKATNSGSSGQAMFFSGGSTLSVVTGYWASLPSAATAITNGQTNVSLGTGLRVGGELVLTNAGASVSTWSAYPATANINGGGLYLTNVAQVTCGAGWDTTSDDAFGFSGYYPYYNVMCDSGGASVASFESKKLLHSYTNLAGAKGNEKTLDWEARALYAGTHTAPFYEETLNWSNRNLSGSWTLGSVAIWTNAVGTPVFTNLVNGINTNTYPSFSNNVKSVVLANLGNTIMTNLVDGINTNTRPSFSNNVRSVILANITPAGQTWRRYAAYSFAGEELITVCASSNGVTAIPVANTITFTIPAGVVVQSVKIRWSAGASLTVDMGTADMPNTAASNRWGAVFSSWREDTWAPLSTANLRPNPTEFSKLEITGLIPGVMNNCLLVF